MMALLLKLCVKLGSMVKALYQISASDSINFLRSLEIGIECYFYPVLHGF